MAFRSSAIASSASGGTLTATPAGVAAHDYLGAFCVQDVQTQTITPPTGWTQRTNIDTAGPDGQTIRYLDKDDASGSDSFAVVFGGSNHAVLITGAWSGRDNTTPRSTTPVTTSNTSANASAISSTITGITATANDDIAVWMCTDQDAAAGRWTYSTITNYTEQRDGVAVDWVSGAALDTRDNVSSGATGNFSATITNSASGNAGYFGIVVAIKAAAGAAATSVIPPRRTNMGALLSF